MLSRAARGTLIATAVGVLLALLFDAMTNTEIKTPYSLIALVSVSIALAVDLWLERGKKKKQKGGEK